MLLPQEIRNHTFGRAIRGYTTAEVDEYINFLADTVDSLNRENAELEQKLSIALEKLAELQEREARVARLDTEMRRAAATLLHEAEKQQKKILEEAHAYADRVIADADAHMAIQKKVREEIREEVLRFKNDLYARYGQHIDQLEAIAGATAKMAFEDSPAAPAAIESVMEPTVESTPVAVPDPVETIVEVTPSVIAEAHEVMAEVEDLDNAQNIEQMDLFDSIDDTEAINKELEEMMADTEDIWTDYTDAVAEEEIDPGFALPEIPPEEVAEESFFEESPVKEETPTEEDDALLLQNLRRAFSVEFDTFEPGAQTKKTQSDDADEFSFVENEPPKKRGFLSRLIGGDSDGE
jgi:DivIVA domain-containing protein